MCQVHLLHENVPNAANRPGTNHQAAQLWWFVCDWALLSESTCRRSHFLTKCPACVSLPIPDHPSECPNECILCTLVLFSCFSPVRNYIDTLHQEDHKRGQRQTAGEPRGHLRRSPCRSKTYGRPEQVLTCALPPPPASPVHL